jgi:formylglycine-generating enzyme required for sulfatase activity
MSGKYALIIGNTEYIDLGLAQLSAPGKDAEDFARVLKDKEIGAFDNVKVIVNEPSASVIEAIDEFFDQKKPDDMLVLYFSGHGIRDEIGSLYLAFKNTIRSRLRSTAIKSDYIREAMDQSRSKRQVLILDCCNSGAFPQGTKAELGGAMGMNKAFQGYGRFVLTASDATQFAWEGDKVIGETDNSLFTHFLVKGLEGEADSDGDGRITVDELYDYTYDQISKVTPKQTPTKSSSKVEGEIVLRQSTRIEDIKPMALSDDLLSEIEDTRPYVREAAVQKLEKILKGKNIGLARSAHEALEKIIADENTTHRVEQAARQALTSGDKFVPQQKKNTPLPVGITQNKRHQNKGTVWIRSIMLGSSILLLSLAALATRLILPFFPTSPTEYPTKQAEALSPTFQSTTFENTPIPSITLTIVPTQPLPSSPITIAPAYTEISTATIDLMPDTTCAKAPKRLSVGIIAQVVTESDYLVLRSEPSQKSEDREHLDRPTKVKVLDGPKCAVYHPDNDDSINVFFWWWKVTTSQSEGWVVEGKDKKDDVFILPENPKDGVAYIYIPPGTFTMGLTLGNEIKLQNLCGSACNTLYQASKPDHKVTLTKGYWIYHTEVSNAQYRKCVDAGSCTIPQQNSFGNRGMYYNSGPSFDNYPVVWVDWGQAGAYCIWAGGRLPTSAEWEYAARGDDERLFSWGDEIPNRSQANVNDFFDDVQSVNAFAKYASSFGLLNMSGNVWEWVSDYYDPTYYSTNTNWIDPKGPDNPDEKNDRVIRGGSAWFSSVYASVAVQDSEDPVFVDGKEYYGVGFRCVNDQP